VGKFGRHDGIATKTSILTKL